MRKALVSRMVVILACVILYTPTMHAAMDTGIKEKEAKSHVINALERAQEINVTLRDGSHKPLVLFCTTIDPKTKQATEQLTEDPICQDSFAELIATHCADSTPYLLAYVNGHYYDATAFNRHLRTQIQSKYIAVIDGAQRFVARNEPPLNLNISPSYFPFIPSAHDIVWYDVTSRAQIPTENGWPNPIRDVYNGDIVHNEDIQYYLYDPANPTRGFCYLTSYADLLAGKSFHMINRYDANAALRNYAWAMHYILTDPTKAMDYYNASLEAADAKVGKEDDAIINKVVAADIHLTLGEMAYKAHDYTTATVHFEKAARQSDNPCMQVAACTWLAEMYGTGTGVPKNSTKSIEYWSAVTQQDAFLTEKLNAHYQLAKIYANPNDAAYDIHTAVMHYKQMADSDEEEAGDAAYHVGYLLHQNPDNLADAEKYLLRALDKTDPAHPRHCSIQLALGTMSYNKRDFENAYTLFDSVKQHTTNDEERATAHLRLGILLYSGLGAPCNHLKALEELTVADTFNRTHNRATCAPLILAKLYCDGADIQHDIPRAQKLLHEIVERNNTDCLVQALELLSNIETSQGNHTAALHFLLEAREKSAVKHPHIDTKIGKRYYYGHGVAQSLSKALHYFNAAIATAPDACADPYYYLALIYGRGCQKFNKNERRAIEFVEKALTMPCTNEMRATMLLKRAQLFFKGSCKNHARAIEDLNHALKQSPGSVLTSKIHHLLGVLYQQKNSIYANATLARKALKKVNGTTPAEHLDSLYRLRDLYSNTTMEGLSLEDQKKALDTIENGIKKHPMNPCVVIERFEQTDHKRKPTDSLIQNRSKRLKQTTLRKDASQLALDFTTAPTHGIATMDQSAHDQS